MRNLKFKEKIFESLASVLPLTAIVLLLRIFFHIPLAKMLLFFYPLVFILAYFAPRDFVPVSFDSGGVASGPMTATFLLPFAMGACEAMGGNIMTDAFGIVAMVAMTPLITIQMMGMLTKWKEHAKRRYIAVQLTQLEDDILYFE